MKFKIPFSMDKSKFGFTLIELVIVVSVISILSSILFINFRPSENKQKARDNVRLSDIAEIERVLNEYLLDNNAYPGLPNTLYVSNVVNWIPVTDMNNYISHLSVDPLNKDNHFYYYMHDETSYEVDAVLEFFTDLMHKDNGDSSIRYEVGNNLNLIPNE